MGKKKKKKYNKVKALKRKSRGENNLYGKAGVHIDKRDKRERKPSTKDYLDKEDE